MQDLISIQQAENIIQNNIISAETEIIEINQAYDRVLREPILADRPIPPFDRAMMDGIAMDSSEFFGIGTELRIAGTQAAGSPALEKLMSNTCFEIMTGAPLPDGCDCVVPIEDLSITGDSVIFSPDAAPESGKFIHHKGSDSPQGETLIQPNTQLRPGELATAASVGQTQLKVSKLPKIQIITSGDEVIPPSEQPLGFQIRGSHPIALISLIESNRLGVCQHTHIADDQTETRLAIEKALCSADFIVFTGGISKGKFDFIAPTLKQLVGEPQFHGVKQRPGKPFAFWKNEDQPAIFALPGNPVSVMATATRYLLPALRQHQGITNTLERRTLAQNCFWKAAIPGFTPATLQRDGLVIPQASRNSGDYLCTVGTDGFVFLEKPKQNYPAGTSLPFFPSRF